MKKTSARQIIIVAAAVSALVTGGIFMMLYANRYADENGGSVEASTYNSIVLTPKNMGSYGELMFAYIGEGNYLYNLDDESEPLINQKAALLLYASDDTVIYTASTEISEGHSGRETIIQELQIGENENTLNTIASVTIDPCWSSNDEVVYYVMDDAPNQLCTFEPLTSTSEVAAEFEENVTGLRISSDGLLVTVASGAEMLYVPLSKQLTEAYYNCQGSRVIVCEQYDLILTPDGILSYRWMGANDAVRIADHVVVTQGYQDNEVLFIQSGSEGLTLNAYFVSEEKIVELAKLPDNMLPQLTVSPDYAFVIDDNFVVYRYNIDTREFATFMQIPEDVLNPMISVFDYRLMVYDLSREIDNMFIAAYDAAHVISTETIAELNSYTEAASADRNSEYSEYHTLQMASVGTEVYALQEKLVSLGYMTSPPTGIFDISTSVATQYLQADLGMTESGIATPEMQYLLFNTSIAPKDGYAVLSVSTEGLQVRDLQIRLRSLGYMKEPVSGHLDKATSEALNLFTEQNGVNYDGGLINTELQEILFSDIATNYHGYHNLTFGDNCEAVTALNRQLKQLGYLTGSVNPSLDKKTETAVQLFAEVNKLDYSGICTAQMQTMIFSETANVCPTDMAPEVINDSNSSTEGQVISDRQLKILRKWLTKQFAINHTDKQAVKRLQKQLVKLGYMSDKDVSMIYDQNTMDAVVTFQSASGLTADGIASKNTLTEIFSTTISNGMTDE